MIGRNAAYLQQFVTRGSPRLLAERDRRALAAFFGVDETRLGAPEPVSAAGVAVPYLALAASAGAGRMVADERVVRVEHFAPQMLRAAGIDPALASIIDATGDSMAPTILAGDRLLVDRGARAVGVAAAVFVLRQDDALLVKRLSRRGARLTIASDNADYTTREADVGTVEVVGRVKLLLRTP